MLEFQQCWAIEQIIIARNTHVMKAGSFWFGGWEDILWGAREIERGLIHVSYLLFFKCEYDTWTKRIYSGEDEANVKLVLVQ